MTLELLSFVDNCCVIANPLKSYCICLICPNQNKLIELLKETKDVNNNLCLNLDELNNFKADVDKNKLLIKLLEENEKLVEHMTNEATKICLEKNVARFEVPKKLKFVAEIWMPDTGLVTDSLKIKRVQIDKFYGSEIAKIYN